MTLRPFIVSVSYSRAARRGSRRSYRFFEPHRFYTLPPFTIPRLKTPCLTEYWVIIFGICAAEGRGTARRAADSVQSERWTQHLEDD